jgi:branched-chain amino acid aminotransferase
MTDNKTLPDSFGFQNGTWTTFNELHWSPTDIGTMFGAIAIERLRTFGGNLHAVDLHIARLLHTVAGIHCLNVPTASHIRTTLDELIKRNAKIINLCGDVSIVLLISPGCDRREPTIMAYIERLPMKLLADRYKFGVDLVVTQTTNVPRSTYDPHLKVRNRLQYYLADIEADAAVSGAIGLLPSVDGKLTDTSFATAIFRISEQWISPLPESILPSVTLQYHRAQVDELLKLSHREIDVEEISAIEEMLLFGTTGQLTAVRNLYSMQLGKLTSQALPGVDSSTYRELLDAMKSTIGFDFESETGGLAPNL